MTTDNQTKNQTETVTVEMTGNMNNEETTQAKDEEIKARLNDAWDAGKRDSEVLELALELGASQELLGKCVGFTTEDRDGSKLPWVSQLIKAGYPTDWVRELVVHHCFHDEMSPCSFQIAFLRDESAWEAFDSPKLLMVFFEALAGAEHMGGDVLRRRDALAYRIGRMRRPDLQPRPCLGLYPTEWDRKQEAAREEEIMAVGLEDANFVARKAVRQLGHPGDLATVKVIESLPKSSRIEAAGKIILNGLGLPFIGRVLGYDCPSSRKEVDWVVARLVREIDKRPDKAPLIYRFLLKGGADQAGGPNRFKMSEHDEMIRHCLHSAGWEFCRLEEHEDSRSGRTSLQAVVPNVRPRLIWSHDSRGQRHEVLRVGDEVIVPRKPINGVHAVVNLPHMQVYRVEIHAAAPPTSEMEKTAGQDFLVR